MLTPEEVKHLFNLARIEATPEELEKLPRELNAILEYVKKLQEAPAASASPTLSMASRGVALRIDELVEPRADEVEHIKKQFPETQKGFLKTKKVFG